MNTYTVEIINRRSGEVLREARIEANTSAEARRFAMTRNIFSGESVGHVHREE